MTLERIISKVRDNDCVLWAGAGFSLYAGMPSAWKLKDAILNECSSEEKEYLNGFSSLSDLTEEFVQLRNGSRNDLYSILHSVINIPFKSTWVHDLLTEIPQINTIVTTNYDRLFETSFKEEIYPIINNTHIPFATNKRVSLYKIHGDINLPESILLTKSDYTNFFRNQDNPIWNKVKTLLAEKTIIFVGFSLEDQNIDYLLDNVIHSVGIFRKESFFISPNLIEHKRKRLAGKNIQYIDMTGEEFIKTIHKEIRQNLLSDIVNHKVKLEDGMPILKKYGLIPDLLVNPERTVIQSLGTTSNTPLELNITFTDFIEGINDVLNPSSLNEIEIPSENILSIRTHFNGITIPMLEGPVSMVFKPLPINEGKVNLLFKYTEHQLSNLYMKVYGDSMDNLLLKLNHPLIDIKFDFKENKLNYTTKLFNHLTEAKQLFNFLYYFFSGKDTLTMYFVDKDKESEFPGIMQDSNDEVLQGIEQILEIIDMLFVIQKFYKVHFKNFDFQLSLEDIDGIKILYYHAVGKKRLLIWLKLPVSIIQKENIEGLLDAHSAFKIRVASYSPITVELLGEIFHLNNQLIYESEDAYLANTKEVILALDEKHSETSLMLKSREKGLFQYIE